MTDLKKKARSVVEYVGYHPDIVTEDAIHAALVEARAEAFEEASGFCEERGREWGILRSMSMTYKSRAAQYLAAALLRMAREARAGESTKSEISGRCGYCGHPKNSSTCQRAHP